jgi:hypothetical protein
LDPPWQKGTFPNLALRLDDRRGVRHIIVQIQQPQQRSQKPLRLPGRQTKHHAHRDGRLDRVIRVFALATGLPALQPGRIPVSELAIGECNPDREARSIAQARLVFTPISNPIGFLPVLALRTLEPALGEPPIVLIREGGDNCGLRSRVVHQGSIPLPTAVRRLVYGP